MISENFVAFEPLEIFYIFGTRLTEYVRKAGTSLPKDSFVELRRKKQVWRFADFGFIHNTWDIFRRVIFCQPLYEDGQMRRPLDSAGVPSCDEYLL
ncbi:hypothetical protein [Desulfonema magnum]|uniref:Uncharacterized protein n=1 Tax=Desulfonema magnum TaxID=45655 RepID=A0A975BPE8_9BACT|nr:hypothetical protein [Desulfonema magnum]QTA89213.1 Uncharacterized protein dnm_052630 [Desulfonema magnum]